MPPPRKILCLALAAAAFVIGLWTIPAAWCGRGAAEWMKGNLATQQRLARTVARQVSAGLHSSDYQTGHDRFNGEWLFGTYLMAGIGLCQMVRQHPETAQEWSPVIAHCIREILSQRVRASDRQAWGADPLETLQTDQGHAAYLGYLNFLLGLYRQIQPASEFTELHDSITAALVRRIEASPNGLVATYPGEWYPMDNMPVIASIALHGKAAGQDHAKLLERWETFVRKYYLDPKSGLLIQAVNARGIPLDGGRGSGSAFGIFFAHHAAPRLSAELYAAIQKNLTSGILGFGAIREYPRGLAGRMDIDSGPIILGFGFSATGFSIAAAKIYGDFPLFAKLYSSAILAGTPTRTGEDIDFLTAGPLGNSILLAMLTATPP